jgi:hypothetical protein
MMYRVAGIFCALLFAIAFPSVAHHSPANFDLTVTDFAVQGKIQSVEFRNPHSEMELLVTDAKGQVIKWDVEFSSVNLLVRRGWKMDRIKVGDMVTCIGNPDKIGAKKMYMWSIKLADGTEFAK